MSARRPKLCRGVHRGLERNVGFLWSRPLGECWILMVYGLCWNRRLKSPPTSDCVSVHEILVREIHCQQCWEYIEATHKEKNGIWYLPSKESRKLSPNQLSSPAHCPLKQKNVSQSKSSRGVRAVVAQHCVEQKSELSVSGSDVTAGPIHSLVVSVVNVVDED